MTKAELEKCFEQVIADIQAALPNQNKLVDYVRLEGKIEAYADALKLISNTEIEPEPVKKEEKAKSTKE